MRPIGFGLLADARLELSAYGLYFRSHIRDTESQAQFVWTLKSGG
jgi:hypothetical protein